MLVEFYKRCSCCGRLKTNGNFAKMTASKDGLQNECRQCKKERKLAYKKMQATTELLRANRKTCVRCGELKHHSNFNKASSAKDGLQSWCKECQKDYKKKYKTKPKKNTESRLIGVRAVAGFASGPVPKPIDKTNLKPGSINLYDYIATNVEGVPSSDNPLFRGVFSASRSGGHAITEVEKSRLMMSCDGETLHIQEFKPQNYLIKLFLLLANSKTKQKMLKHLLEYECPKFKLNIR